MVCAGAEALKLQADEKQLGLHLIKQFPLHICPPETTPSLVVDRESLKIIPDDSL
jgi:hypothetical protein